VKEDKLTNAIIERHKSKASKRENSDEKNTPDSISLEIRPEEHYNHYGTRGIVDLFIREKQEYSGGREGVTDYIIEVKSELRNANEVIRQANKMHDYFYKGSDWAKPFRNYFSLYVELNPSNYSHIKENMHMYQSLSQKGISIFFCDDEGLAARVFPTGDVTIFDFERWSEFHSKEEKIEKVRECVKGGSEEI